MRRDMPEAPEVIPTNPMEWPPRIVKQRWQLDGVDRPLPKLGTYVRLYVPGPDYEDWLYRVVWVDHIRHRVGLQLMSV